LDIDVRKRIRALIITLPVIHILNLFRNAGLIWLHHTYEGWNWLGLSMFDFGHLYAARVASLAAMFLMAIILFELLPTLHRNVLVLMSPLGVDAGLPEIQDQESSGDDLLQV
jgi:exosortase/archaeosortase family protein